MKYNANLIGYDTMEYGSARQTIEIIANDKDEAMIVAKDWCKEHSFMGGYEWHIERIVEVE